MEIADIEYVYSYVTAGQRNSYKTTIKQQNASNYMGNAYDSLPLFFSHTNNGCVNDLHMVMVTGQSWYIHH